MKVPKKFHAGLVTYKVSMKKQSVSLGNGTEVRGYCDPVKKEVWVSPEQTALEQLQTFFHEFFHAQISESGVRQASLSHDVEEIICEFFSTATVKLLKSKSNS